jgi:NADPH:quinone reductase-like Zn-dependent oxidoreductase
MSGFIAAHGIKPVVEREIPIARYEEALKLLESGSFVGKIVLTF